MFRLKLDKEAASLSDRSREFHSFAAKLILVQWPHLLLAADCSSIVFYNHENHH